MAGAARPTAGVGVCEQETGEGAGWLHGRAGRLPGVRTRPSRAGPPPCRMRARLGCPVRQLAAFAPKNGWPEVETPTADGAREREPVVVIFVPSEGR